MQLGTCTSMYWLTINREIANHVQSCVPCQTISNYQQREPVIQMEVPSRPWKTLGIELILHNNNDAFLLLINTASFNG